MEPILTLQEALEQGYTGCVYAKDGYQHIKQLAFPDEIDWKRDDIYLVNKESYNPAGMDSKEIAETLADQIYENHYDEIGDDTDAVWDVIKAIDFSDVEERINNALSSLHYYRQSKIRLKP
jgi:hypothetical protein